MTETVGLAADQMTEPKHSGDDSATRSESEEEPFDSSDAASASCGSDVESMPALAVSPEENDRKKQRVTECSPQEKKCDISVEPKTVPRPVFGSAAKSIVSFTALAGTPLPAKNLFASLIRESEQDTKPASAEKLVQAVDVVTGEEDEDSLISLKGKLFEFNVVEKSWAEKGAGLFKLNSARNELGSFRILMRLDGVQRLILNSRLFKGMICECVQEKNLRFSAYNLDAKIQTYLLRMRSAEDAQSLEQVFQECLAKLDGNSDATEAD